MEKYPLVMKVFAVGIVFLIVGISFIPCIALNIVKASNDNDLVKVTTQAYNISGDYTSTVLSNTTTTARNTKSI